MNCINCNLELPEGAKECPFCKATVNKSDFRCPACFVKLKRGTKVCAKCGLDIEEFERERKEEIEIANMPKPKMSTKKKILISSLVGAAVLLIVFFISLWNVYKFNSFKDDAKVFVKEVSKSIEIMDEMAEDYGEVYSGEWLVRVEKTMEVERGYKEEKTYLEDQRDSINYLASRLSDSAVRAKHREVAEKLYADYDSCFVYVVGKNGDEADYIGEYNKISKSLKENLKELKNIIK